MVWFDRIVCFVFCVLDLGGLLRIWVRWLYSYKGAEAEIGAGRERTDTFDDETG